MYLLHKLIPAVSSRLRLVSTVHISFVPLKVPLLPTSTSLPTRPRNPPSPSNPLSNPTPPPNSREASAYPAIYLCAHYLALTPALGQRPVTPVLDPSELLRTYSGRYP
ncbi:hypothetical protein E4T56_gene11318 [Termitomyces sp. T112]|nr:hypothetical protein E4T56_gene11318 [Termitomyces sp. T112]